MKINDYIDKYLERTLIYKRKGTYDYYLKTSRSIKRALKFNNLILISDLNENSQTDILIYFKTMTKKKNSQINSDISFLYTVLKYYKINHKMTEYERLRDDTTSFTPLDDETLVKLIKWLKTLNIEESNNAIWSLTVYLMLETGVRTNELLNIKTKNINFDNNTILLENTKNGLKRIVFFDALSVSLLSKLAKNNKEFIIWNYNKDEQMTRAGLFYFFNIIHKELKPTQKITAHRLRKTFATRLLKSGCPLTTIQKLLGHTDIRTTMKYLQIDNDMLERDYFKFYPYTDL